jgi:hypothetical protein
MGVRRLLAGPGAGFRAEPLAAVGGGNGTGRCPIRHEASVADRFAAAAVISHTVPTQPVTGF